MEDTLTKKTLVVTQTIVILSTLFIYFLSIFIYKMVYLEGEQEINNVFISAILTGFIFIVAAIFFHLDQCYLEVITLFTAFTSFVFASLIDFNLLVFILVVIIFLITLILLNGKNFKRNKEAKKLVEISLAIEFFILLAGFFSVHLF